MIEVYKEEGEDSHCRGSDVSVKRKIVEACTVESDERGKSGTQLEKSLFLERYKDEPELIRQAKFFQARIRDENTGRWVMEEHTKVYKQVKGEWEFKETVTSQVKSSQVIDDGRFQLVENQAQQVFEDHSAATFSHNTGNKRLTMSDMGGSASSVTPVTTPKAKAKAKAKAAANEDTSSDEEMSPMEKQMAADSGKTKKGRSSKDKAKDKDKDKDKGKGGAGGGAGGGGGAAGGELEASTEQFIQEVMRELDVFKASLKVTEATQESLESLASRLQSSRIKLSKKAAKKGAATAVLNSLDTVSRAKTRVNAMVDLVKSNTAFQKRKIRKHAASLEDKFHGLKVAGVTLDMLPVCLTATPVSARACILSCDNKFKECPALVDEAELRKAVPAGNDDDIALAQRGVVVQVMVDQVRHLLDTKDKSMVSRVVSLCTDFQSHTNGEVQRFVQAVVTVLNDKSAGVDQVIEACVFCVKLCSDVSDDICISVSTSCMCCVHVISLSALVFRPWMSSTKK